MQVIIQELINIYGYLGIFLLIVLETVLPPIPSEVILTFGGFLTLHSEMNLLGVIVASSLGAILGALLLYALGHFLNPERLEAIVDSRFGQLVHLRKDDFKRAEEWFLKHGQSAVFFGRFIPVVRSLISIPAGMASMSMAKFILLSSIGTIIWNSVLVYLGYFAGDAWLTINEYLDVYSMIALAILVVVSLAVLAVYIQKRFKS